MMDIFNIIQFPVFKKIEKEHTAIKSIYDEDEDAEEKEKENEKEQEQESALEHFKNRINTSKKVTQL